MLEKSGHSVVAVELSPTYLKLVEFFPFDHRISAVAVEPLDGDRWSDERYLSDQIRAALERHMRAETAELVSAVHAGHAYLRTIEISEDEEDYLGALKWDMEQYLARPLNEYLMDYQSLGSNASENGRVYLVAAYRRSEVERLNRIWELAGFPLDVVDVDAFAVINALEANYPETREDRVLILKADAQGVLCIRTHNGLFHGYDAIVVEDSLLDAARKVCSNFQHVESVWGKVSGVFLCGDFAASPRFLEALETGLPVPVTLLDAFKNLTFADDIEASDAIASGPQCAGVAGLALRRAGDC